MGVGPIRSGGDQAEGRLPVLDPPDLKRRRPVLAKSSSSPFSSTTLDYLLRNMGIRTLIVMGLLTDQCIDHTIKDAADRGYRVVCLEDACQAITPERHGHALACFQGYAALMSVAAFEGVLASYPSTTS
jgi:nicotinamidase-related amidase